MRCTDGTLTNIECKPPPKSCVASLPKNGLKGVTWRDSLKSGESNQFLCEDGYWPTNEGMMRCTDGTLTNVECRATTVSKDQRNKNRALAWKKFSKECLGTQIQIALGSGDPEKGEIFKIGKGFCDRHVDKSTFDAMQKANPKLYAHDDWERSQAVPAVKGTSEPMKKILKVAIRGEININCSEAWLKLDESPSSGIILQNCPVLP